MLKLLNIFYFDKKLRTLRLKQFCCWYKKKNLEFSLYTRCWTPYQPKMSINGLLFSLIADAPSFSDDLQLPAASEEEKLSRVRRNFDRRDLSEFDLDNEPRFILADNIGPEEVGSPDGGALELALPLTYPGPVDYNGDQEILSRHKFDTRPDFGDYQLLDQPMMDSAADQDFQPYQEAPSDSDRLVFSRNERLDVKKPGPYWPLSDRSYFLNKVILGLSR